MKPSTPPSDAPSYQPSCASTTATSSVTTASTVRSEDKNDKDDIALVIGGSIAGGLLLLWCGFKLFRWSVQSFQLYKQKRGMQSILDVNQLQRAKEISMQRHKARASGALATSRLSVTAVKTKTPALTISPDVPASTPCGVGLNNKNDENCTLRSQDEKNDHLSGSDSSVILSSLHSSEISYIDEHGSSIDSVEEAAMRSEGAPIQFTDSRPLSHARSRESLMEEGSVVSSVVDR